MTKLEAMKARLAAATPGPWRQELNDRHWGEHAEWMVRNLVKLAEVRFREDARFLAHARTDMELLLAVADATHDRQWTRVIELMHTLDAEES